MARTGRSDIFSPSMKKLTPYDLPALPDEVKMLLSDGVYSLYEIDARGITYLLIARTREEFYFLSESGEVLPKPDGVATIADVNIVGPVSIAADLPASRDRFA